MMNYELMGTTYRLLLAGILYRFTFGFSFEMCFMLGIVYFDVTGQLFSPRVVIVFDFHLSPFGLRLSHHLGLRLSLLGHVCFQYYSYFC